MDGVTICPHCRNGEINRWRVDGAVMTLDFSARHLLAECVRASGLEYATELPAPAAELLQG